MNSRSIQLNRNNPKQMYQLRDQKQTEEYNKLNKIQQVTDFFKNKKFLDLSIDFDKKIEDEIPISEQFTSDQMDYYKNLPSKPLQSVGEVNLVHLLTEDKLQMILEFLSKKKAVSKQAFFDNVLEILGNTEKNFELQLNVYDMIDLEDSGYIRQANFVDFLFEQGQSKTVKSGYFNFDIKKELKIRCLKLIVYEQIGLIGIQEKYTFKFYQIRYSNYTTIGIINLSKDIKVTLSVYLPDFQEILIALSDKTFGFIDRKDYQLKRMFKQNESIVDIQYALQIKTLLTQSISGRIEAWNMEEYFSPVMKLIAERGQINFRMILAEIPGQDERIFSTCTSFQWIENLKLLLLGCRDSIIYVFNLGLNQDLKPKINLKGHKKPIKNMRFSNRTKYVYSAAGDNLILVHNPFVETPITCINVFKDTDKIITDIRIPDKNNVVIGITEDGQVLIWDMLTYAKLSSKNFGGKKSELVVFEGKSLIATGGFTVSFIEYSQQHGIQKIHQSAFLYTHKYNMLYLGMKNKIVSLNALTMKSINQKPLEEFDKIMKMEFNKNEKQIVCASYNGKIIILHAFTFEILLTHDTLEENFLNLLFYEKQNFIIEVFHDRVRFINYDLRRHHYEISSEMPFENNNIKCFDLVHNVFLFGFANGLIIYSKLRPAGLSTISFKIGVDSQVNFGRIIYEDGAIFVGDGCGGCYYIRLSQKAGADDNLLNLFKFEAFFINLNEAYNIYSNNIGSQKLTYVTNLIYIYDKDNAKTNFYVSDNKGHLYCFTFDVLHEEKVEPLQLSYIKTNGIRFNEEALEQSYNEEVELALATAQPVKPILKRLSKYKIRFMVILEKRDLLVITKGKSIKIWNLALAIYDPSGKVKASPKRPLTIEMETSGIQAKPVHWFKIKQEDFDNLVTPSQNPDLHLQNGDPKDIKNYNTVQLNALHDDMKNLIGELVKIDQMIPKNNYICGSSRAQSRGPVGGSVDRKNSRIQTGTGNGNKGVKPRIDTGLRVNKVKNNGFRIKAGTANGTRKNKNL